MAGGVVFQMGQATPANKELLWNFAQCSQNLNMDCPLHLSTYSYRQKETEFTRKPPHNFTNFRGQPFREKAYFSSD